MDHTLLTVSVKLFMLDLLEKRSVGVLEGTLRCPCVHSNRHQLFIIERYQRLLTKKKSINHHRLAYLNEYSSVKPSRSDCQPAPQNVSVVHMRAASIRRDPYVSQIGMQCSHFAPPLNMSSCFFFPSIRPSSPPFFSGYSTNSCGARRIDGATGSLINPN